MALLDESDWTGRIFRTEWVPGAGQADVTEPATGDMLGRIGIAGPDDVAGAAADALAAQRAWAGAPYPQRAAVLREAGRLCAEHADELTGWLVREGGAVPAKAGFEIGLVEQECLAASALPALPHGELLRDTQNRMSWSRQVPVGVVGVIAPFNFPLILAMRSVAPALALGNAVVLKPDPRTAVCGGAVLAGLFAAAGLPPGLLHVLPGGADVGEAIVTEPAVRVVSFTGSTAAGRAVSRLAADSLTRVHLELGGNSALVVLPDVDVERAASAGAWGSFLHQGQICMTTGRHLVHADVYPEYVERLAAIASRLPVGDPHTEPVALGPLIDAGQRDRVHGLVRDSVAAGARLTAGGEYDRLYYRPTVLSEVTPEMPAYATEVFGPVAPVAAFDDADHAAALAAADAHGLSLGILTRDVMAGLALADRIPTGIVHINDQTVNDEATAPFGGVADSGTGARFGGPAANIAAFTDTRWITARARIPSYPM